MASNGQQFHCPCLTIVFQFVGFGFLRRSRAAAPVGNEVLQNGEVFCSSIRPSVHLHPPWEALPGLRVYHPGLRASQPSVGLPARVEVRTNGKTPHFTRLCPLPGPYQGRCPKTKKDKERERDVETQTDRDIERPTKRQTATDRQRQTLETDRCRHTQRPTQRQTYRQTETDIDTDKHRQTQTDKQGQRLHLTVKGTTKYHLLYFIAVYEY